MTKSINDLQQFFLARELAEVYLLLDHIAAIDGKSLPKKVEESGANAVFEKGKPWLQQICDITWPSGDTTPEQDARNAAKLILAKDALTEAAKPASGTTIAFTLLIAGEARETEKEGSWWARRLPRVKRADGGDGGPPGLPSRASLAALAHKGLADSARVYRNWLMFLIAFLFGWAILTCFVSWDVATGTALLNRVTTLEKRIADYDKNASAPGAAATPTPTPSFEARQAEHDRKSLDAARQNLGAWLKSQGFIRKLIKHRMGAAQEEATIAGLPATPSGLTPAETNIQWAVALLSIFASNVLPIFYGLLGAGAAVVRGVSNKVRDSTLTPRDVILAYVQLVLGAVMGLCIGLFVNPASGEGAAQNGLISNSIWLSASALCFVAGFGVDQVFRALEWLIRRIFDPEVPKTTVKP